MKFHSKKSKTKIISYLVGGLNWSLDYSYFNVKKWKISIIFLEMNAKLEAIIIFCSTIVYNHYLSAVRRHYKTIFRLTTYKCVFYCESLP